jgi:hypothetical protein
MAVLGVPKAFASRWMKPVERRLRSSTAKIP